MSDIKTPYSQARDAFAKMVADLKKEIANKSPEYQKHVWFELADICEYGEERF